MNSVATQAPGARRRRGRLALSRPILLLLVVALAAGSYFAYDRFLKPQPVVATPVQQVTVSRGSIAAKVSSTGSVVPAATADLSFATSGQITELNAGIGQTVRKGDVLARLDTTDLQLAVLAAEANLASAESKLATLAAGSTAGDIATARAQVKSSQASLDKLRAGATSVELQSAKSAVASANSQLQKAQSELADLKAGPTETEITTARIAIEKAKIAVQNAQGAYDKIAWKAGAASSSEAMTLWQATTDYQAAEIAYNEAMAGPTATEMATAEQAVVSAQAQLATAEAALATLQEGPTDADLSSAEAAVIQAQTQLETKLNPSTAAELKAAQATLAQANVALDGANSNMEKATMVAPFDGVVAAVSGAVGQTASATVVSLLDMSAPQLQITVTESDVAKIAVDQPATLTFDALGSGLTLAGKVTSISPKATVSSGVATYTATISIERPTVTSQSPAAPRGQEDQAPATAGGQTSAMQTTADLSKLKAGMTGSVSITYLSKDDVIVVANKAVKTQGRNRVVEVFVDGKAETRTVTVGAADDTNTEILSGLREGDRVLISGTATTTTTGTTGGSRDQQGGMIPGAMPPSGPGF